MKASSNRTGDDFKVVSSCDVKQIDIFVSKGIAAAVGRCRMLLGVLRTSLNVMRWTKK